ncbi:hypothetical protein FPFC_030630 [Fructobacillus pseudoficulneus]|uniref:Uncharacterized protein n=1 Tax=Fructobacillus pseudoficulneus TaxID=220714 RepID=A0A3F3H9F1_9LACO|nr:hypothetical protein FPFC_030630 [Fructobacillus pseudoficulneus]SEH45439.1 hypothetical protein SAMN05660469_1267 [Fructobacillus pseudoficulneus]
MRKTQRGLTFPTLNSGELMSFLDWAKLIEILVNLLLRIHRHLKPKKK